MRSRTHLSTWFGAVAIGVAVLMTSPASAEETNTAALATAMKSVPTSLEQGLKASEKSGKPISAKFEINEAGKLQLSVYTLSGDGFAEVLVAPDTGAVASTEKITNADDLKAADAQKAAMDKAAVPLIAAVQGELRYGAGAHVVSIFPELKGGRPIATITLLRDGKFDTVSGKLD